MSITPTQQAFFCQCDDEDKSCAIIFASDVVEAQKIHANACDWDPEDITVQRDERFDQYAPGPVPNKALIEAGWTLECSNCYRKINVTDDDLWLDDKSAADLRTFAQHNAQIDADIAEVNRNQNFSSYVVWQLSAAKIWPPT